MNFDGYQEMMKGYNAAHPFQQQETDSGPLEYRAGSVGSNMDQLNGDKQYADWMGTLTPSQRAEYQSQMDARYAKGTRNGRLGFALAAGGMAALGAGGLTAAATGGEATGATSFPVSSGGPLAWTDTLSSSIPGSDIGLGYLGEGGAGSAGALGNDVGLGYLGGTTGSTSGLGGLDYKTLLGNLGKGLSNGGGLNNLLSGVSAIYQARQMAKLGKGTPYSQVAGDQLTTLLNDPSSITKMPGYEAGLEAVQRTGAKQGYLGSGNMMIALDKYGGDFYNNTVRQLMGIAEPGRGIDQQYNFGGTQLFGEGLNSLGYWLSKFGSGN